MEIDQHWTRLSPINMTFFPRRELEIIEYINKNPQSHLAYIRISKHAATGNISATIKPKTNDSYSKLIHFFACEESVYWSLAIGSATFYVNRENHAELFQLFSKLTDFDPAFSPIEKDLQILLDYKPQAHHATARRERSPSH